MVEVRGIQTTGNSRDIIREELTARLQRGGRGALEGYWGELFLFHCKWKSLLRLGLYRLYGRNTQGS